MSREEHKVMDSASKVPLRTKIAKFFKRSASPAPSRVASTSSIATPSSTPSSITAQTLVQIAQFEAPEPHNTSVARQYKGNDGDVRAQPQAHGPIINLEGGVGAMIHQPPSALTDHAQGHQQAHAQIINIERAGNAFTGVNYGHVTQIEEFHVLRNLPMHPDVSVHLSDYFPDSRSHDEAHILRWIDSTGPPELVLCVLGKAGVGKSTLAKHLATRLRQDNRLAAEIFLGFALPDWTPESVFRMVAGQLCATYPALKRAVSEAIDLDVGPSVSLETRIRNFILEPIRSLCLGRPLVIVLDALDQWAPHPIFIKALSCLAAETHLIRFISFGRPGLEDRFRNVSFRQNELPDVSKRVMRGYFRQRFEEVQWEYGRKPSSQTIDRLVDKADGLFIWSSTLCSVLEDELSCPKPHDTLTAVLQSQQSIGDNETLANLYHTAINLRFPKPDHKAKLKVFLGAVLALQEPLPITAFALLVSMEVGVVRKIREDLGPLQTGQAQDTWDLVYPALSTFHLSFVEYVQSPDTPPQLAFPINTFLSHSELGKACLEDLRHIPSSPNVAFMSPLRKYAMKYWPTHITHGTPPVTPTSDAEWRATPHCAILNSLSVPQWRHWASAYLQSFCTGIVPNEPAAEASSTSTGDTPQRIISQTLKSLRNATVTGGTSHAAITVAEVAVRLQHQRRDAWLDLGRAYRAAAKNTESNLLIESAVRACRDAAELDDEGDFQVHQMLALCLWLRFFRLGSQDDLDEAISLERAVLLLTPPGHPDRAIPLNNLAQSLQSHHKLTGTVESLDEALVLKREALSLLPQGHPDRATSLISLALSLQSHYNRTGTVESLDEALVLQQEALSLRPRGHPNRAMSLNNLASSLQSHHELTGTIESLDEAIGLQREALPLRPLGHPDRAMSLNNLASSLQSHHKLTGTVESLDEALVLQREVLSLQPRGHPNRATSLNNLATLLQSHHELTGAVESLDEALVLKREVLSLRPRGHPDHAMSLNNLANSLQSHHELTGMVESLDEALVLQQEALSLQPRGHPNHAVSLHNLANSLRSHHKQTGMVESLDKALVLQREALSLWPQGHPQCATSLNNLADSLQCHHELTGTVESLDEAIMLHREALLLWLPGHPHRALSLNNLAVSLDSRFKLTATVEDLDEAIALHREVLSLSTPGNRRHTLAVKGLAKSLQESYRLTGNIQERDEALALLAPTSQPV